MRLVIKHAVLLFLPAYVTGYINCAKKSRVTPTHFGLKRLQFSSPHKDTVAIQRHMIPIGKGSLRWIEGIIASPFSVLLVHVCFQSRKNFLFGFEMAPGKIARVAHIPITVDLGRIGTRRGIFIGEVHTVDRQARQVPGIDEGAEVARLPAEGAGPILGERRGNGSRHRAAWTRTLGGRRSRGKGGRGRNGAVGLNDRQRRAIAVIPCAQPIAWISTAANGHGTYMRGHTQMMGGVRLQRYCHECRTSRREIASDCDAAKLVGYRDRIPIANPNGNDL